MGVQSTDRPGEGWDQGRDQTWERNNTRNQALFREVNEQISKLSLGGSGLAELVVLCECSRNECSEPLTVSSTEYEAVRRFPTRFVLKPGHETVGHERVVEVQAEFVIVE